MANFTVKTVGQGGVINGINEKLAPMIHGLGDGHTLYLVGSVDQTAEMKAHADLIAQCDLALSDDRATGEQRSALLAYKAENETALYALEREAFKVDVDNLRIGLEKFRAGWDYTVRNSKSKGKPSFEITIKATMLKDNASVAKSAIATLLAPKASSAPVQTRRAEENKPSA